MAFAARRAGTTSTAILILISIRLIRITQLPIVSRLPSLLPRRGGALARCDGRDQLVDQRPLTGEPFARERAHCAGQIDSASAAALSTRLGRRIPARSLAMVASDTATVTVRRLVLVLVVVMVLVMVVVLVLVLVLSHT